MDHNIPDFNILYTESSERKTELKFQMKITDNSVREIQNSDITLFSIHKDFPGTSLDFPFSISITIELSRNYIEIQHNHDLDL